MLICLSASARSDYYKRKAESYTRESDYWQRKADGYRREPEFCLGKAENHLRNAAYYTQKCNLARVRTYSLYADEEYDKYNAQLRCVALAH